MNKLNIRMILTSFIVGLVLIIGSGFAYQYFAQQKPLEQRLNQVEYSDVKLNEIKKQYELDMNIKDDALLIDAVHEVESIMKNVDIDPENYQLKLHKEQDELQNIWEQYLFEVADMMANKQYSKLPNIMENMEAEHHIETVTAIDERYIYITLVNDHGRLDQLLPLVDTTIGVWDDAEK